MLTLVMLNSTLVEFEFEVGFELANNNNNDGSLSLTECQINFYSEMEYCANAASMLAKEIWQIAEGLVEVPINL